MSESGIIRQLFFISRKSEAPASGQTAESKLSVEAQLVARVRKGDNDAFGELYKLFARTVHGIILSRVPRDEAPDLVQDVFLLAFKNLDKLRNDNAFGGWLSMIARNRTSEFHRHQKSTEELTEEIKQENSRDEAESAHEILIAIQSLPEAYRETLVLRLVEGMTGPEIAARTGLKAESVRVNLHRGMKLLREKLVAGVRSKK